MDQRGITLSGDHFSDADYADDVAAMEYDPTDIKSLFGHIARMDPLTPA